MRILVVGGAGFIGCHLVREFTATGHKVTVMGRSAAPARPLPAGVAYVCGSIEDPVRLRAAIADTDAVAHLASATVPSTGDKNPLADVRENLIGTLNLLCAMIEAGVHRLLYLSSGGTVYGVPQTVPLHESHPLNPVCSYGVVKVAVESYLEVFARNHGLRYVTIRASNPYGPFQGNVGVQGIISTYLNRIYDHKPLEIWGDGSIVRDHVYVEDLARLCAAALESDRTGVYNCGSGVGTSVAHIVDLVREVTGSSVEIIHRPARVFDVPASVLTASKAMEDFDWRPQVELWDGISRTWRWLREARASRT